MYTIPVAASTDKRMLAPDQPKMRRAISPAAKEPATPTSMVSSSVIRLGPGQRKPRKGADREAARSEDDQVGDHPHECAPGDGLDRVGLEGCSGRGTDQRMNRRSRGARRGWRICGRPVDRVEAPVERRDPRVMWMAVIACSKGGGFGLEPTLARASERNVKPQ